MEEDRGITQNSENSEAPENAKAFSGASFSVDILRSLEWYSIYMWKFCDKTFFKFLFGFLLILIVSFILLIVTNAYKLRIEGESQFANPPGAVQNQ